ncbi:hypothetical protein GCM10027517_07900 [Phycicoccus ginsengisoli]
MSHGTVVQLKPNHRLGSDTAHAVVAAQLRGESRTPDAEPEAVVAAVASEIEDLGLQPDREELAQRYGQPTGLPEVLATRPAAG